MTKKILVILVFILMIAFWNNTNAYFKDSSCYELWIGWVDNWDWTCSCDIWFHFEKNIVGKLTCVPNNNCKSLYWEHSVMDKYWNCSCERWYMFYITPEWEKYCINWKYQCNFMYWDNSVYDLNSNTCGCKDWYELIFAKNWYGYQCRSCESAYGSNSFFNKNTQVCECKEGYKLINWKCQQSPNFEYFYLAEYDYNNRVKVLSYDTFKAYSLRLESRWNIYEIRNYIWEMISVNMWTDKKIDVWDVFTLDSRTEYSWVTFRILEIKEVSYNYTLGICEKMYWINSINVGNNKCVCKEWYKYDDEKKSCEWVSFHTVNNYYEINADTKSTNSIFDTSWLKYH